MSKKSGTFSTSEEAVNSPFASLFKEKGIASEDPGPAEVPATVNESSPVQDPIVGAKLLVRRSRKGRGGKTTTQVEGLSGDAAQLKAVAKLLGKALGCGAFVEDDLVVIQGDQRGRLVKELEARGARRVRSA